MTSAIDTAVDAFRATLVERGALAGAAATDAAEVGRRAALLVQSATAWQDHLGALLDVRQTMALLASTPTRWPRGWQPARTSSMAGPQ